MEFFRMGSERAAVPAERMSRALGKDDASAEAPGDFSAAIRTLAEGIANYGSYTKADKVRIEDIARRSGRGAADIEAEVDQIVASLKPSE